MATRLDRLQRGLFESLTGIAPHIVWTQGQVPRQLVDSGDSGELLSLRLASGPVPVHRAHSHGFTLTPASSIIVTVTGATVGTRNVVRLNDFAYYRDTVAGDTVATVRNVLLAAIQEGESGAVTATASGAAGILLAGDFLGGLRSLELVGQLTSSGAVISGDSVIVSERTMSHLVTLQAFSRGREPRTGAVALLDLALDELRAPDVSEELSRYGLGVWDYGAPVDLSAIAGGNWESRASADLTISARSVAVRSVHEIDSVGITVSVGVSPDDASPSTFEAEASAP